ncbi:MAG: methyltransferase domain-containing protein [Candidatus Sericytochromatia bacterium]|nr:methyltransferase domain-containing protein [Candidatus Sericytochromatia bacterium]
MSELSASPASHLSNTPNHVRHFQWNDDYIELLSHRLELAAVRTLVEVGSGLGHLAALFGLYMKPGSQVRGFDPDPAVVAEATARAAERPFSVGYRFEQADLHRLPMGDGEADLVISHHVLANVPDPAAVLAEMVRLVRPGGRVVAFEPNQLVQALVLDSDSAGYPLETRLELVRYQAFYEAGKRALGRGHDSIGDALPQLFLEAGLRQVEVRISDKAGALVPPYDTEEKRARVAELLAWQDEFEANADLIRACFAAGGATPADWEAYRRLELAQAARIREGLAAGTYVHPGGMLTYIVSGAR